MIGGGGERKTLRLVAQYADATNIFGGGDNLRRKYAVLRERCDEVGRPFDEIERTNLNGFRVSAEGAPETVTPAEMVDRIGTWHDAGSQHAIFSIRNVYEPGILELGGPRRGAPGARDGSLAVPLSQRGPAPDAARRPHART